MIHLYVGTSTAPYVTAFCGYRKLVNRELSTTTEPKEVTCNFCVGMLKGAGIHGQRQASPKCAVCGSWLTKEGAPCAECALAAEKVVR